MHDRRAISARQSVLDVDGCNLGAAPAKHAHQARKKQDEDQAKNVIKCECPSGGLSASVVLAFRKSKTKKCTAVDTSDRNEARVSQGWQEENADNQISRTLSK